MNTTLRSLIIAEQFNYLFWLSQDKIVSHGSDIVVNQVKPGAFVLPLTTAKPDWNLDGSGASGLIIPTTVPPRFCGKQYLIVQLDTNDQVTESDETNNRKWADIIIECPNGKNV